MHKGSSVGSWDCAKRDTVFERVTEYLDISLIAKETDNLAELESMRSKVQEYLNDINN